MWNLQKKLSWKSSNNPIVIYKQIQKLLNQLKINIFGWSENFDGGCMVDGGGDEPREGGGEGEKKFCVLQRKKRKWKNEMERVVVELYNWWSH